MGGKRQFTQGYTRSHEFYDDYEGATTAREKKDIMKARLMEIEEEEERTLRDEAQILRIDEEDIRAHLEHLKRVRPVELRLDPNALVGVYAPGGSIGNTRTVPMSPRIHHDVVDWRFFLES